MLMNYHKIDSFKEYLSKPLWELHESAWVLAGITHFSIHFKLDPFSAKAFKIKSFGLFPDKFLTREMPNKTQETYRATLESFRREMIFNKLRCCPIKTPYYFFKDDGKDITYLLSPEEAIAAALVNGIILPIEFQKELFIYQIETGSQLLSKPIKKSVMRHALAQIFWFEYPEDSISGICRKINEFKESLPDKNNIFSKSDFDFINESQNRTRNVVKSLKPKNDPIPFISGVYEKQLDIVAFDFQRLHIVVNIVANFLYLKNPDITEDVIFSHPLIKVYIDCGGEPIEKILKFSLREILEILE